MLVNTYAKLDHDFVQTKKNRYRTPFRTLATPTRRCNTATMVNGVIWIVTRDFVSKSVTRIILTLSTPMEHRCIAYL